MDYGEKVQIGDPFIPANQTKVSWRLAACLLGWSLEMSLRRCPRCNYFLFLHSFLSCHLPLCGPCALRLLTLEGIGVPIYVCYAPTQSKEQSKPAANMPNEESPDDGSPCRSVSPFPHFFSFVICCMRLYYVLSSLLLHARSNKTLSAPVCYRLLIGIRSLDGGERRDDDSGTSKNGVTTTSTTTLIIPFYLPLPRCFSAFHFPFINHNLLRQPTLRHASSAYRG